MAFNDSPKIALIEDDDIVRQATSQWLQLAQTALAVTGDVAMSLGQPSRHSPRRDQTSRQVRADSRRPSRVE